MNTKGMEWRSSAHLCRSNSFIVPLMSVPNFGTLSHLLVPPPKAQHLPRSLQIHSEYSRQIQPWRIHQVHILKLHQQAWFPLLSFPFRQADCDNHYNHRIDGSCIHRSQGCGRSYDDHRYRYLYRELKSSLNHRLHDLKDTIYLKTRIDRPW